MQQYGIQYMEFEYLYSLSSSVLYNSISFIIAMLLKSGMFKWNYNENI